MTDSKETILSELNRVLHILTSIEQVLQEIEGLTSASSSSSTPPTSKATTTTTIAPSQILEKDALKDKNQNESIWNKQELLEEELSRWKEIQLLDITKKTGWKKIPN
jgi:hypothetical protein